MEQRIYYKMNNYSYQNGTAICLIKLKKALVIVILTVLPHPSIIVHFLYTFSWLF